MPQFIVRKPSALNLNANPSTWRAYCHVDAPTMRDAVAGALLIPADKVSLGRNHGHGWTMVAPNGSVYYVAPAA